MTFRKRKKAHAASPALERGNKCSKLLQEHNRQDGLKTSDSPNVPQLRPVECFFGQPETSSVCWQLGSIKNWSAKEKRPLEGQKHWCWAFTKRILGPPDEGQTFFFVCSIPLLKYTPSKVVQFFTAQALRTTQGIVYTTEYAHNLPLGSNACCLIWTYRLDGVQSKLQETTEEFEAARRNARKARSEFEEIKKLRWGKLCK